MKRLIASIASTLTLLVAGLGGSFAAATSSSWALSVSQLSNYTTSHKFNVQYTVLSTTTGDGGTNFCVELFQNGNPEVLATQNTLNPSDSNTQYGNSGAFPVTVASDGTYSYTVQAFNGTCSNSEDTQSGSTTTIVDTIAPNHPDYLGKTASGSSTVVNFTAPSDSDVATVNIYAGSAKTYDGDNAHLLKTVSVIPGQTYNETVSASASEFFSVQAFDQAGNGSSIVGDPGTVVNPVVFVNNGVNNGGTGGGGGAGTTTAGQVLGVSTGTNGSSTGSSNGTNQGQVNAPGSSKTNKTNNNGKVLGVATTNNNSTWWQWTGIVIVILFVLGLLYRLFLWKTGKP